MNSQRAAVAVSPEKEDRYYMTRGLLGLDEKGKMFRLDHHNGHLREQGKPCLIKTAYFIV